MDGYETSSLRIHLWEGFWENGTTTNTWWFRMRVTPTEWTRWVSTPSSFLKSVTTEKPPRICSSLEVFLWVCGWSKEVLNHHPHHPNLCPSLSLSVSPSRLVVWELSQSLGRSSIRGWFRLEGSSPSSLRGIGWGPVSSIHDFVNVFSMKEKWLPNTNVGETFVTPSTDGSSRLSEKFWHLLGVH